MGDIALYHSVLGIRPGIHDATERLGAAGHDVTVVDQYGGRSFDDYAEAGAFVESIGFPALMERALAAVAELPDGFVTIGLSNGAGMAEHVALHRRAGGVVMLSGALPPAVLGVDAWPPRLPAQIHYARDDPYREQEWLDATIAAVRSAGAPLDLFLDYPGAGHLFTDPSLPAEYDAEAADLLWSRVLDFCDRYGS